MWMRRCEKAKEELLHGNNSSMRDANRSRTREGTKADP